jgi:hypothetical protein
MPNIASQVLGTQFDEFYTAIAFEDEEGALAAYDSYVLVHSDVFEDCFSGQSSDAGALVQFECSVRGPVDHNLKVRPLNNKQLHFLQTNCLQKGDLEGTYAFWLKVFVRDVSH